MHTALQQDEKEEEEESDLSDNAIEDEESEEEESDEDEKTKHVTVVSRRRKAEGKSILLQSFWEVVFWENVTFVCQFLVMDSEND